MILVGGPPMYGNMNKAIKHSPLVSLPKLLIEGKGSLKRGIQKRLYNKVVPFGYENSIPRLANAILFDNKIKMAGMGSSDLEKTPEHKLRDEIFAEYLNIPYEDRHFSNRLAKSSYRPSISTTKGLFSSPTYYKSPTESNILKQINEYTDNNGSLRKGSKITLNDSVLGSYNVSRGRDNKGDYISYYDSWDLSPFGGANAQDESFGIGKPVEFYNRFYLDDIEGLNSNATRGTVWLPEVKVLGKTKAAQNKEYIRNKYEKRLNNK